MFCRQCGNQIPNDEKFCNQCGTPAVAEAAAVAPPGQGGMPEPPYNTFYEGPAGMQPPVMAGYPEYRADKPKKKTMRTMLLIAGGVLVLAVAVLIPVLIEKARSDRYEAAFAMMDIGDFEEAKAAFVELGEYRESADMAGECQNTLDYNAAAALMNAGDMEKARDGFTALGNFKDAADMSAQCQNTLDYDAAVALMDAGSNEAARAAFAILGSFKDAAALATECQNRIDYSAATALMDAQDYQGALKAFTSLWGYSDSSDMAKKCQKKIDYIAADTAYKEGKFFTAFLAFYDLGDFEDSFDRCYACIQDPPKNGELYHNPDYGNSVSVIFKVGNQDYSAFIKIYSEDGNLVSTVFIAKNSKVKVKLPKGKYRFKAAYGIEWFGEKEIFGDYAIYSVLIFPKGEFLTLSSNAIYTISLLQEGEGNINGLPQTLGSF